MRLFLRGWFSFYLYLLGPLSLMTLQRFRYPRPHPLQRQRPPHQYHPALQPTPQQILPYRLQRLPSA